MNWWEAFKLAMRFIPAITALLSDLKAAKADDDKVSMAELIPIIKKFIEAITAEIKVAVETKAI